jgi:Divergent InlB B-repeat domain/Secretion system C-terminal sorting domain/Putative binding domain, N-terminal
MKKISVFILLLLNGLQINAQDISGDPNNFVLGTHSEGYTFSVKSNIHNPKSTKISVIAKVKGWNIDSWASIVPTTFDLEGNASMELTINGTFLTIGTDNNRLLYGTVIFFINGSNLEDRFNITFQGSIEASNIPILNVNPLSVDVPLIAGTTSFSVGNSGNGTLNWSASSNTSWITITSGSSGTNSGTINVSYLANTGSARSGSITVSASGASGSPLTITINQAGVSNTPILSVSPTSRGVSYNSGTTSFSVGNSGNGTLNWSASSNTSWITITSGSSGTNSGTINVSYLANTGSARSGSITVSASGASGSPQTMTIAQQKFPLKYNISTSSNPSNAGSVTGSGAFDPGQNITLIATANEGWEFINWLEGNNIVSSLKSYTFIVSENKYLVANFKKLNENISGIGSLSSMKYQDLKIEIYDPYAVGSSLFYDHTFNLDINKFVVGVRIRTDDKPQSTYKNIKLIVTDNNTPMTLTLNTNKVVLDKNNDTFIDFFPSEIFPNTTMIECLASSIPYNSNQEKHTITAKITEVDGIPVKVNASELISNYFAKNNDNNSFSLFRDAYKFSNPHNTNLYDWISELYRNSFFGPIVGLIKALTLQGGKCYGMATTSGLYFLSPSYKPFTTDVFSWDSSSTKVMDQINAAHLSQHKYAPIQYDFDESYNYLLAQLKANKPVLINLEGPVFSDPKHTNLAIKLSVYPNKNKSFIYFYENESPKNLWAAEVDLTKKEFSYVVAQNMTKFLSAPEECFQINSMENVLKDITQALNNELRSKNQKGFASACPVNLLVTDIGSGKRTGYTVNGIFVNEIDSAEITRYATADSTTDSATVILVPAGKNYTVYSYGYSVGKMRFEDFSSVAADKINCVYKDDISVTGKSIAKYDDKIPNIINVDIDGDGTIDSTYTTTQSTIVTDIKNQVKNLIPTTFGLLQNYPNPFNPSTKIKYLLKESGYVRLSIYNMLGQEVTVLVDEYKNAGTYEAEAKISNSGSGIYFYRLQAKGYTAVKKMILLK